MIDRRREKLIHATIFFSKNTRNCYKLKLFKLLYFLDFDHFRQTGRSVTGLEYFAWKMGPVPKSLFSEFDSPAADLSSAVSITPMSKIDPEVGGAGVRILARRSFDENLFSNREIRIMKSLAEIYRDATAVMMSEASHLVGKPWDRIYIQEKRPNALIPYSYAIDGSPGSITPEAAEALRVSLIEMGMNFS